jgi:surface antigen
MRLSSFLLAGTLALTVAVSPAAALNNPFGGVGLPLTRQDFDQMAEAESPLLNDEAIPFGTSREWANASSGNSGTITLIDRFETNFQGTKLPCRKLRYHVVIRNRSDPYNLLLDRCQVADGRWKLL